MRKLTEEHLERIRREPPQDVDKILRAIETITPRHYLCYRTAGPITIDGRLDEPSWQKAPWTDLFVHIVNIQGCRCWPVQIGPFPPVALSVPFGISNKCDRLPLSNGAVQVSAQWYLTSAGLALTICRWLWV